MKRVALLSLVLVLSACRSVTPVRQLRPSWEPNISRIVLLNGTVVTFNRDFGWYDKQQNVIEGTTDSGHVSYHLNEVTRVETVRAYELAVAILTSLIPLGIGMYGIYKLLNAISFL